MQYFAVPDGQNATGLGRLPCDDEVKPTDIFDHSKF
jgi:hypothetical protein